MVEALALRGSTADLRFPPNFMAGARHRGHDEGSPGYQEDMDFRITVTIFPRFFVMRGSVVCIFPRFIYTGTRL